MNFVGSPLLSPPEPATPPASSNANSTRQEVVEAFETPRPEERVLVMAPTGRDGFLTEAVLTQNGLLCEICASMEALRDHSTDSVGAVLIAEEAIFSYGIGNLQAWLSHQEPWSDLPLLILTSGGHLSRTSKDTLALMEGSSNITLLERPLRRETLVSAAQTALRARRHQYQMRDLLQQLKEGVRQRDEFLAMLGHELRNPLFTIYAAIELLNQSGSQDPQAIETRRIVERQTQHLSHLIDDLLDVTRITQGKIPLKRQTVDLNDIARRCMQAIEVTDRALNHKLTFTLSDRSATVEGDVVRLEQIINNLLTNAVKYTPAGGTIELIVATEGDSALVRVCDSGLGIDAELQPYVFDLFTQSKRSLDRSQGGLGIGLTVTRGLVEMHGGNIRVKSEGLGKGSEFEVRLPLVKTAALPAIAKAAPLENLKARVLIIEDNADARLLMKILLRKRGCEVEVAEDGVKGVKIATSSPFDVALIDIGLPGIDGYEVARRIRAATRHPIFLLALTGYGQAEDQTRALEAGFDLHMTKPVEPDDLIRVIAEATQHA